MACTESLNMVIASDDIYTGQRTQYIDTYSYEQSHINRGPREDGLRTMRRTMGD
jgi:hypothetical protein